MMIVRRREDGMRCDRAIVPPRSKGQHTLYGPLGIRGDDRYRNVAQERVVEMIAFMGWYNEVDPNVARRGSSQALERWIDLGLAFRSSQDGRRSFDPVEVNNFMRRAVNDDFYSKRFVPALRRLIADAPSDAPPSKR
jgi:hypothetical protein